MERILLMVFTPHGRHLIAGAWVSGETTFASDPASGPVHRFSVGTPALVEEACAAAEEAFWSYGYSTRESRAAFLEAIADEIEEGRDVFGLRFRGQRFDCGSKAGFLQATVAFGLERNELKEEFAEYLHDIMSMRRAAE